MNPVRFRLRMARGFLREAEEDYRLERWRAALSHAQLAVEHGIKAVIALFTPVPKTHDPAQILEELIRQEVIPSAFQVAVQEIISLARSLGSTVHIQTDYGDELHGLTPWELFSEEDAREALEVAHRVVHMARQLVEAVQEDNDEA